MNYTGLLQVTSKMFYVINNAMNTELFKNDEDYWGVANTIKELYMSDGSMEALLNFERVLDLMDVYAFQNWSLGELVEGPEISRYSVACTFMWPLKMMPDPRGAKRLMPFDCNVTFLQSTMKVPAKVTSSDDFRPNTKKPKMIDRKIWLVEIVIPKDLISDIREGSIELEGQTIDLEDLDLAYEEDLDQEEVLDNTDTEMEDEIDMQGMEDDDQPFAG